MSALHHAQLLLELRDFMRTKPAGFDGAEAVEKCLDQYFGRKCTLDAAFGLALDVGEKHPGRHLAMLERNASLCAAGAMLGEVSDDNSKILATKLQRYFGGPWKLERALDACPPNRAGQIEEHFWRALNALERPIGWRQIKETLAAQRAGKSAPDFRPAGPSSVQSKTER